MEGFYSRIKNKDRTTSKPKLAPMSVSSDNKFKCWRCGGDKVVPSSLGDDMSKIYYCHDCKEHIINSDSSYLQ